MSASVIDAAAAVPAADMIRGMLDSRTKTFAAALVLGVVTLILTSMQIDTYMRVASWKVDKADPKADANSAPPVADATYGIAIILLLASLAVLGYSIYALTPQGQRTYIKNKVSQAAAFARSSIAPKTA